MSGCFFSLGRRLQHLPDVWRPLSPSDQVEETTMNRATPSIFALAFSLLAADAFILNRDASAQQRFDMFGNSFAQPARGNQGSSRAVVGQGGSGGRLTTGQGARSGGQVQQGRNNGLVAAGGGNRSGGNGLVAAGGGNRSGGNGLVAAGGGNRSGGNRLIGNDGSTLRGANGFRR